MSIAKNVQLINFFRQNEMIVTKAQLLSTCVKKVSSVNLSYIFEYLKKIDFRPVLRYPIFFVKKYKIVLAEGEGRVE